jgi:hypothetical protein
MTVPVRLLSATDKVLVLVGETEGRVPGLVNRNKSCARRKRGHGHGAAQPAVDYRVNQDNGHVPFWHLRSRDRRHSFIVNPEAPWYAPLQKLASKKVRGIAPEPPQATGSSAPLSVEGTSIRWTLITP